ncbi:MAG: hypothetical protein KDB27_30120 [Planctomycetales bacterium]|nr:hypothetical protein [Planctomycetales bacterium]
MFGKKQKQSWKVRLSSVESLESRELFAADLGVVSAAAFVETAEVGQADNYGSNQTTDFISQKTLFTVSADTAETQCSDKWHKGWILV